MKRAFLTLAALLCCLLARADEGMWLVNAISRALEAQMQQKGLELSSGDIYNEESGGLCNAIVSLDFGCTGSFISSEGLLVTNHHCAYGDVHALSTPEHNYLEDGFWAMSRSEEIAIKGKKAYLLHRIIDVTDEVGALKEQEAAAGKSTGLRRLSWIMEKRYAAQTGYEASLSAMWAGERYYMALYDVYDDVRLVAAPPVSIAAFGGDVDNWEWPQHKCDFALYRVYKDGAPLNPRRHLQISRSGYVPGDFAMVIGYPGRTDRYSSSYKVEFEQNLSLPISNRIRGRQMEILRHWMDADPAVRLKYADKFFSLSNVQELDEGQVDCYKKYGVVRCKRREERKMHGCDSLLQAIKARYRDISDVQRGEIYYRETLVRCGGLNLICLKLKNNVSGLNLEKEYAALDMRVERDLFRYCIEEYFENEPDKYLGAFQKELKSRFGSDYDAMAEYLWLDRPVTREDGLFRFFTDINASAFASVQRELEQGVTVNELEHRYTRALYQNRQQRGLEQYPDANFTMRLTFGTVKSFRRGCKKVPWQTCASGILAKEDTAAHDFCLKSDWRCLLCDSCDAAFPVNFITDNDITGGNSGSPVLNARGEIIGLAFDGNKESLASNASFTAAYNRCVCVDIRFVLWTLEHYAKMDGILAEIGE